ncbi:LpqB family beta-propeller domain-containing protein [Nesterenkonia ebinurensis]|uniref:LpqB family beta-propeller domain-containing protein n=1 Tax=Nesterenkonia ebinurensis TaxID=2608252 RepID=UPI00123D4E69|nr:LpqB family beta-propeller domain-containing protein [Nesterenkonia ebinurensis]
MRSSSRLGIPLAAVLGAVALLLAGCAPTLPTDGEVSSEQIQMDGGYDYGGVPQSPQPGAEPEEIIEGFLDAGANAENDHEIAREYLTPEMAEQWNPWTHTLVYQEDNFSIDVAGEDVYSVQLTADSRVDSTGARTYPGDPNQETFEVEQVDGEWRISNAPDGKILEDGDFNISYDDYTLYFYDVQQRYTVPDVRWLIRQPGQSTELANRLLNGPVPWLAPGVVSAFEEGDSLGTPTVPVSDGVATVDLDPSVVAGASDYDLALMHYQLNMTLHQISLVSQVELTVGGSPVELPGPESSEMEQIAQIESSPSALERQIGVQGDDLIWQLGSETSTVASMPDLSEIEPRFPAVSTVAEGEVVAVMNGELNALYHARADADEPELLVEAESMTRPSMDNFGWTWTATYEDGESTIRAFNYQDPEASPVAVAADFIEGREVTSLRISQDGTRAALVVDDAGVRSLYIAGVVREAGSGAPWNLGQSNRLHPDDQVEIGEVRWAQNDEVVVWQPYDPQDPEAELSDQTYIQRIGISGDTEQPSPALAAVLNVSVGEGRGTGPGRGTILFEQQGEGVFQIVGSEIYRQDEIDEDVTDLSFSG